MNRIARSICLFVFAGTLALLSFGCEPSNEQTCKTVSFKAYNLIYDELSRNVNFAYNPNFTGTFDLVYENNRIVQVKGGLYVAPPGQLLTTFFVDNTVVDAVSYNGNTITVASPKLYSKDFVIFNDRLISQKTTYSPNLNYSDCWINRCADLMTYEYDGDVITEMAAGQVRRKFYMSNGNLERVELSIRNGTTAIKKVEYTFSEYDNSPNLLKGKFYLNGKFFTAFSANNYRRIETKVYNFVNNVYELDTNQYSWAEFGEVPADLFTQDCQ